MALPARRRCPAQGAGAARGLPAADGKALGLRRGGGDGLGTAWGRPGDAPGSEGGRQRGRRACPRASRAACVLGAQSRPQGPRGREHVFEMSGEIMRRPLGR